MNSTIFQIWKIIQEINIPLNKERKNKLKMKLEIQKKHKDDIILFIEYLYCFFNELKILEEELTDKKKYNHLYIYLSYEIINRN